MKALIILMLLLIAGCSPMRQGAIDTSTENIQNAETMREMARNCRSAWLVQSGFFDALIGNRKKELPAEVIEAKDKLDQLAEKTELSDYELGLFLGLTIRLKSSVVQVILEKYAPNVIEFLPLVF